MVKNVCTSCKTDISIVPNSTKFLCPQCGKEAIVRCGKCRMTSTAYKCVSCGFMGP